MSRSKVIAEWQHSNAGGVRHRNGGVKLRKPMWLIGVRIQFIKPGTISGGGAMLASSKQSEVVYQRLWSYYRTYHCSMYIPVGWCARKIWRWNNKLSVTSSPGTLHFRDQRFNEGHFYGAIIKVYQLSSSSIWLSASTIHTPNLDVDIAFSIRISTRTTDSWKGLRALENS